MKRRLTTSCWDERAMLVVLPTRAEPYVRLAQAVLDAVPQGWERILASVVVRAGRGPLCSLDEGRGDGEPAGEACRTAVRDALAAIASRAMIPGGLAWVGIWLDFEVEAGRMVVTMMHGGPVRTPPIAVPAARPEAEATAAWRPEAVPA